MLGVTVTSLTERVARAIFEAPDPDDPDAPFDPWPPSNPIDRQWFETRAQAAIGAVLKEVLSEVRAIPCWAPRHDADGGEFDLDGLSHRQFVIQTILAMNNEEERHG